MSLNIRIDEVMWYIYTIEYHFILKNDILKFAGKWMEQQQYQQTK